MSKKDSEPQGFEQTEYGDKNEVYEKLQAIFQIAKDVVCDNPNRSCRVMVEGNGLKVIYHAYEMHVPQRLQLVHDQSKSELDEFMKTLKKEFKSKTGSMLSVKERKELADYRIEKTSLNERYTFISWRVFELDLA